MKRLLMALLLILTLLACRAFSPRLPADPAEPPPAHPTAISAVNITGADIIYYDIQGATEQELRAQMDVLAPVGYDGYKGDALTTWHVYWNWDGYGNNDCDLTSAKVTYAVEVAMPRWEPPQATPATLIIKWNAYIQALAEHEQVHVNHVVQNYGAVLEAIQSATCSTAEAAAQAALEPLHKLDADFDQQTNHGMNDGAVFP